MLLFTFYELLHAFSRTLYIYTQNPVILSDENENKKFSCWRKKLKFHGSSFLVASYRMSLTCHEEIGRVGGGCCEETAPV